MIPAAVLLLYGLAVALAVAAVLSRLTAQGTGARLGLVAWTVAMTSVLASAAAATWLLVEASRGAGVRVAGVLDGHQSCRPNTPAGVEHVGSVYVPLTPGQPACLPWM